MTKAPGLSTTDLLLSKILLELMGEKSKSEQILALSQCEIMPNDIGSLLGITGANASQQVYLAKKTKGKKKPKSKKK